MKKGWKILALVLGIAIFVCGMVLIFYGNDHTGYAGGVTRTSTSIEFGADFYTTSAQYTGLAANAVCDLYDLVKTVFGMFFMFIGATDVCLICGLSKKEEKTEPITKAEEVSE